MSESVSIGPNETEHIPDGRGAENQLPFDDPGLATIAALVGLINIALLLVMLGIYLSSYRRLPSRFTLGLVFFALLLILQNALFIFFLIMGQGFRGPGMGGPVLSLNIIQFGALIVLLKITWD
ncbi:MAG TPA: hypothetical protein VK444_03595 [Methanobacteriaceae archaeon]|nr:hypothetical protein [Methanobacteriaceae archaeon]